jgi:DNA-binding FadR family transcriptional regulator
LTNRSTSVQYRGVGFQQVHTQTAHDAVYDQIVDGVVNGDLPVGETLPSERDLAHALGVSRPTVREALRRVAAAGLIETRQGGGSTVRDLRDVAGLELLPRLLVRPGVGIDLRVARSIIEARARIGPVVAQMAAERATQSQVRDLSARVVHLEAAHEPTRRQELALAFWDAMVDCADSITFRLMFNALRAAYEPALGALAAVMSGEVDHPERYRQVVEAVTHRDPEQAAAATTALLSPVSDQLLAAIAALHAEPDSRADAGSISAGGDSEGDPDDRA